MAKVDVNSGGYKFETYISPYNAQRRACYIAFDSTQECSRVVDNIEQELVSSNFNWFGRSFLNGTYPPDIDFVGSDDPNLLSNISNLSQYLLPTELDRAINNLSSITQNLKLGSVSKKARFEMSALSTGVFNFSSASSGLYRKREYFAPTENRLVNQNDVLGNSAIGFYTINQNQQKIPLEVRQENTTEMLRINPQAEKMQTQNGMIYTKPIRFGNLSLKFATTSKKIFLIKKQIKNTSGEGNEKYVDLYICPDTTGGIRKENIMFSALPSLLCAQILENAGFKVKIHKYTATTSNGNLLLFTYPLKDYGEPTNIQRLMIDAADPRVFRYIDFRRFSALFGGVFQSDLGSGFGGIVADNDIDRIFNEYKHWIRKKLESGEKKLFNKNMNLHLLAAVNPTNDDFDTQLANVSDRLTNLLDKISFQFTSVDTALKEAVQRIGNAMSRRQIFNYMREVLQSLEPSKCADASLDMPDSEFANVFTKWQNKMDDLNNQSANYQ